MAKGKSIGATLVLKEGNFFTNAKKAVDHTAKMQSAFVKATSKIKLQNSSVDKLSGSLKTIAGTYISVNSALNGIKFADQLVSAKARIDNVNDGLQTTQELNKMIYQSAGDSRSSYSSMADLVTRIGANAGKAFSGTAEIVDFAEQIQKRFVIAGATTAEAENAVIQLSQGLAAGALRGEELNSVLEQAPNIARSIEKYMGIAEGQIKTVASKGLVTADVVKNAIMSTSAETDAAFANMPKTFSQVWTDFKNKMQEGISPFLLEHIPKITKTLSKFTDKLPNVFDKVSIAAEKAGKVIVWLKDNWSWLGPVIGGVVAAVGSFAAIIGVVTAAIKVWTTVQTILNIVMTMNPIGFIIIGVAALIGIITFLAIKFEGVRNVLLGVWEVLKIGWTVLWENIVNVFEFAWGNVVNYFTTIINFWKNIFKAFKLAFQGDWKGMWSAVGDAFKSIWDGIKKYFTDAINFVSKGINALIRGINKLQFDVPEGVPVIGGLKFGFNIPEIPMLAKGGVISRAGMTIVGERGPELLKLPRGASVIPLNKGGGGNQNTFHINIYTNELDDEAINRFVSKVKFAMANM